MYIRGNTALKQWEFPVGKEIQQMLRMLIGYFSQVKSRQIITPRVPNLKKGIDVKNIFACTLIIAFYLRCMFIIFPRISSPSLDVRYLWMCGALLWRNFKIVYATY